MNRLISWIRQKKASRIAYVAVAVLGFSLIAFDLLGFHVGAWIGKKFGPSPQEVLGVFNVGYNFTPYAVGYQLGERTGGDLMAYRKEGGGANGAGSVCCYKPEYPGQPLIVRWNYYGGLYGETDRNVWHYEATLNPSFPKNEMPQTLTVRFYPGGRVAVRYTDQPESSDFGNVSPELSGSAWVQAQGTPLPPLLAKEQEVRNAGQGADLEARPAPAIPAAGEAAVKTNIQGVTQ